MLSNAKNVVGLDAVKDLEVRLNAAVVPFLAINDVASMDKELLVILILKIRMVSHTKLFKDNKIQNFLHLRIIHIDDSFLFFTKTTSISQKSYQTLRTTTKSVMTYGRIPQIVYSKLKAKMLRKRNASKNVKKIKIA